MATIFIFSVMQNFCNNNNLHNHIFAYNKQKQIVGVFVERSLKKCLYQHCKQIQLYGFEKFRTIFSILGFGS